MLDMPDIQHQIWAELEVEMSRPRQVPLVTSSLILLSAGTQDTLGGDTSLPF